MPEDLRITRTVLIPTAEVQWTFIAAGGPGGQHANTSNTAAELRFDVETSVAFSDAQRARIIEKLGPQIRIVARDERSQLRNRELATQRLVAALSDALKVPTVRRATRPSKGAVQRRLTAKTQRAGRKADRRYRPSDD
jgi:ribosome-associated protein